MNASEQYREFHRKAISECVRKKGQPRKLITRQQVEYLERHNDIEPRSELRVEVGNEDYFSIR
jgi:hypothetical protein